MFYYRTSIASTMRKTFTSLVVFAALCSSFIVQSQVISAKVVDTTTQKPIPYVTIQFNKSGVITNGEGRFSFLPKEQIKATDSLIISCIGFGTVSKALNQFKDSIIYLTPKTIELKEVILTNKKYTAKELIEKVKENITKNYNFDLTKKRLFYRESNHQNFVKSNYTLKKSTIDALNKPFLDSVVQSIPKTNDYYTEVLCDLYGNYSSENQKIDLIKASELYDKNNEMGVAALEEKFNRIINENVKSDSYFKIKSGIFGQKLDMDEFKGEQIDSTDAAALKKKLDDEKKREAEKKENFAKYRRSSLTAKLDDLFFNEKSKLNFIQKSRKYNFQMRDLTYLGNDAVYVVAFEPKGAADYKGVLYINYDDFAILRVDYENVKNLKNFRLLGISYQRFLAKGKMIFAKGNDNRYNLQYLESEDASRFGIKRPLKIIEKNKHVKGRNKQNELYVKLDMAMINSDKHEVVVFDTQNTTEVTFADFKENNEMLPTYMPRYNPEFWKGYSIMEPNQAIKNFTIIE
tara:strand:- start:14692 stop:16245 length:1554 start_codon:yes stop_codon:yes gene_type:complete